MENVLIIGFEVGMVTAMLIFLYISDKIIKRIKRFIKRIVGIKFRT